MRVLTTLLFLPTQALAWDFSPQPVCTLSFVTDAARIEITHDPAEANYRLELLLTEGSWVTSPTFGITFEGGSELTIGTRRHVIDGSTLTVTDTGFGNVLNGLEFNRIATAFTNSQVVRFPLIDAAEPVQKFRQCVMRGSVTS